MTAQEAMDLMERRGHETLSWGEIYSRCEAGLDSPVDLWTDVLLHWQRGWREPGQFYVYVAFSGGRLGLLDSATAGRVSTAEAAVGLAALAALRYEQVWVVSDAGAWSAQSPA